MLTLKLANGLEMEYAQSGDGDEKLLLLHGYADSWYSFHGVMQALPADFSAVSISQRGHGKTDAPLNGYSIASMPRMRAKRWTPSVGTRLLLADIQWALLSPKRWLPAFLGG